MAEMKKLRYASLEGSAECVGVACLHIRWTTALSSENESTWESRAAKNIHPSPVQYGWTKWTVLMLAFTN